MKKDDKKKYNAENYFKTNHGTSSEKEKLEKLKTLGIPVFMAVAPRGTGKTYFFEMIKEDLEKRNKRVLYLYADNFTMAYVKEKIKKDKIEVILLDESEAIL